jgi:hypothetical protein
MYPELVRQINKMRSILSAKRLFVNLKLHRQKSHKKEPVQLNHLMSHHLLLHRQSLFPNLCQCQFPNQCQCQQCLFLQFLSLNQFLFLSLFQSQC